MKIIATKKKSSFDGKGNPLVVDNQVNQIEEKEISEVWINSGGSFNATPLLLGTAEQPFKLPESGRKQLLDESYRLWKFDPIGGNIVRTTTYFTLGRGLIIEFDDKVADEIVKKFFKKNKLNVRLRAASNESSAFGEVYIWLRPKKNSINYKGKELWRSGDTQVTFIPPHNITNIETAEEDVCDVYNYVFEYEQADYSSITKTIPDISKYDIDKGDEEGCIIQIKMNSGNMDAFGHSDLIPIKEWLDNYQEYLRDGVVINKLYRSPCFDISIEDATPDEISAAISRYRGWSIGSNPVHSAREKWQILEFKGPSSHNEEARRSLLLMIATGVNFAEFMLADGSNSNLASSRTQQLPVIKKFEDRQDLWAECLMEVFQFVLMIKAQFGSVKNLTLEKDSEGDYIPFSGRVEFPALDRDKDLEVAQTNQIAIADGYMSKTTAARRLNLSFDNQLEEGLSTIEKESEIQKEKIDKGVMLDPTKPDPTKIAQAENRLPRDRSREPGGSRSSSSQ